MRAIVLNGGEVSLDDARESPKPQAGDAIVRPTRCAIGRLDVEVARGLMGFCGVLGREFVGVVESVVPPGDVKLKGKRVTGSIGTACGECDLCQRGLSAHCRNRTIMGLSGRDGCFADAFAIIAANLTVLPQKLDDDRAVFAQLAAAAIQPVRQLTIEGKPYITVLGDGPLALLTAQVMSKLNASVRLIGKHPEKFTLCEKWGIKHRHANDIGRRADQDIVVDCTGSAAGFDLACRLVRPRGKVLVKTLGSRSEAGNDSRSVGNDLTTVVLNEIEVIGSSFGSITEGVDAIARGEIDVVNLISKRMKLSDGVAVLNAAARPETLRVLLDV